MSSISLRPAVQDDLSQIIAIETQNYPQPWKKENFIAEMEKPYSRLLVLTDDETDSMIYGYICYWIQAEGVSLHNVSVDSTQRGLGLGMKMMQAMIKEAVKEDIPKITLEVRMSNKNAIQLYERIGFKTTHERKKFYNDGETALVMEIKTSDASGMVH